jgi:hypothetical protein
MPLNDQEKTEARNAIALAIDLNEPETIVESLRRLCARKAQEPLISDNERSRWRNAHEALGDVAIELERANAPQRVHNDAQEATQAQSQASPEQSADS